MTKRSRTIPYGIPTTQIRWLIPTQLRLDLKLVAQVTGWNEGELAAAFIKHCLQYLVPAWNERSAVQIPQLRSLDSDGPLRPFTIKELMAEVERHAR